MKFLRRKFIAGLIPLGVISAPLAIVASCGSGDGNDTQKPGEKISNEALAIIRSDFNKIILDVAASKHDQLVYQGNVTSLIPTEKTVQRYEFLSSTSAKISDVKSATTWSQNLPTSTDEDGTKRHFWARIVVDESIELTDEQMYVDLTNSDLISPFNAFRNALIEVRTNFMTSKVINSFDFKTITVTAGETFNANNLRIFETVEAPKNARFSYQYANGPWISQADVITAMKTNPTFQVADLINLRVRLETVENQSVYSQGARIGVPSLKSFFTANPWLQPLTEAYNETVRTFTTPESFHNRLIWSWTPRPNDFIVGYQYLIGSKYKTLTDALSATSGEFKTELPATIDENPGDRKIWVFISPAALYTGVLSFERRFIDMTTSSGIQNVVQKLAETNLYQAFLNGVKVSGSASSVVVSEAFPATAGVRSLYQYRNGDWISRADYEAALNQRGELLVVADLKNSKVKLEVTDPSIYIPATLDGQINYLTDLTFPVPTLAPTLDRLKNIKLGREGNVQNGAYEITFTKEHVLEVDADNDLIDIAPAEGTPPKTARQAMQVFVKQTVPFFEGSFNHSPMPLFIYNAYEQKRLTLDTSGTKPRLFIGAADVTGPDGEIYGFTTDNINRNQTAYKFSVSGLRITYVPLPGFKLTATALAYEIEPTLATASEVADGEQTTLKNRIVFDYQNLPQAQKDDFISKLAWNENAVYSNITYSSAAELTLADVPAAWRDLIATEFTYYYNGQDQTVRPTKLDIPQVNSPTPYRMVFVPKDQAQDYITYDLKLSTTFSPFKLEKSLDLFAILDSYRHIRIDYTPEMHPWLAAWDDTKSKLYNSPTFDYFAINTIGVASELVNFEPGIIKQYRFKLKNDNASNLENIAKEHVVEFSVLTGYLDFYDISSQLLQTIKGQTEYADQTRVDWIRFELYLDTASEAKYLWKKSDNTIVSKDNPYIIRIKVT